MNFQERLKVYDEAIRLHKEYGWGSPRISKKLGVARGTVGGWLYEGVRPKDMSQERRGEKNPAWKGDLVSANCARLRICRKSSPWYISVPEGYERHHIDGNLYNNSPENIEIVTRRQHMEKDGRLEKLIKRMRGRRKP